MSYIFKNKQPPYKKVCIGIRGHYGDIMMQEPGLRKFIQDNPDTKITLAVSKKYKDILPLFHNYHENVVEFKAFDGYNDWPTKKDLEYINDSEFDAMFPPDIPKHPDPNWANHRHIIEETALMIGLEPNGTKINLDLPSDIIKEKKTACIHMFSSQYPHGIRSISPERQKIIVDYLRARGYKVYQISSPSQPHIEGTEKPVGSYYEACLKVLSTDFLISCDSGMSFVTSAYNHPTATLCSSDYHPAAGTARNWYAPNPNGYFLESGIAENISIYKIYETIDKLIGKTK